MASKRQPKEKTECNICNKPFSRIKEHMTIHSDLKAFVCIICDKSFRALWSLKEHNLSHKDEKGVLCKSCDK